MDDLDKGGMIEGNCSRVDLDGMGNWQVLDKGKSIMTFPPPSKPTLIFSSFPKLHDREKSPFFFGL